MPTAAGICQKQLLKVIDDLEKVKVNEEEISEFMPDIYRKLEWLSKEDLIKRMVSHEFNRFAEQKVVSKKEAGKLLRASTVYSLTWAKRTVSSPVTSSAC